MAEIGLDGACVVAVVGENADDLFELRWRDNASASPIKRPRLDLALLCPDAAS